MADAPSRLALYKRIAGAGNEEDRRAPESEKIDRFGLRSEPATIRHRRLRLMAQPLGIARVDLGQRSGAVTLACDSTIDAGVLDGPESSQPEVNAREGGSAGCQSGFGIGPGRPRRRGKLLVRLGVRRLEAEPA